MFGLRGMERNRVTPARHNDLDELLNGVYSSCCPKPNDYQQRRRVVRRLKAIAKEAYGNSHDSPVIEEFGSFVMDMFSPGSDLDLSINFSNNGHEFPRDKKIKALKKLSKTLIALQRKGLVADVQVILGAKVPIVKVTDCETGIECDLSVENRDGVIKSQIIYVISTIDERFRKLCILMKAWAKGHNINSSKDRSLNSLSIISLIAFHLQTRDPPILPPFVELLKDGTNPASVLKLVPNYRDYAKRNTESLGDLFFSLLAKLEAVENLWSTGLCASSFLGSWISKTDSRKIIMNVEDFTDRSQNVARAVGVRGFKSIYDCIHNSLYHLLAFLNGEIHSFKLRELIFRTGTITVTYLDNNGWERWPGWGGERGTEGWDEWVGQKQTGFGGKWEVESSGEQAGGRGENHETYRGRKRKQQTEGREEDERTEGWGDWGVIERKGLRDKRGDRQPVDSRGSKRVKYSGARTDAAAHYASPFFRRRPYEADPIASQFSNRVSSLRFEDSHGPPLLQTVSAHFLPRVVTHVEDRLHNTQFPPPGRHETHPVAPSARRFEVLRAPYPHDHLVHNPVDSTPFSRQNRRTRLNQNEYSGLGRPG